MGLIFLSFVLLFGYYTPLSSIHSIRQVQLFVNPWMAACQDFLSITNSRSSLRLTSIELVMPSSHLETPDYFLMFSSLLLPQLMYSTTTAFRQNTQYLECIWVSSRKDLSRHTHHLATRITVKDSLFWIPGLQVALSTCHQITTFWAQKPAD